VNGTVTTRSFRNAAALTGSTRLLFLTGRPPDKDGSTIQQLAALGPGVHIFTVAQSDELLSHLEEAGRYHAVVISHALPPAETLKVVGMLRKASAPVAILPVVTESQRDLYSSAIAAGADDVVMLLAGVVVHPAETLNRAKQSRHLPPASVLASKDDAYPAVPHPTASAVPAASGWAGIAAEMTAEVAPPPGQNAALDTAVADLRQAEAAYASGSAWSFETIPASHDSSEEPAAADVDRHAADHEANRAAWDVQRLELEARIAELESAAQTREPHAVADADVETLRADLERQAQAHAAERAEWDRCRKDMEAALAAAEAEVEQIRARDDADSAAWQHVGAELEARAQHRDPSPDGDNRMLETLRSERDDIAAQLRQARRLEEAGRLAATMAPDLDGLPALVDVCLERLARAGAHDDTAGASAHALTESAATAMPALRQLVRFSRKQARPLQPINLSGIAERMAPVFAHLVGAHIDVAVRTGDSGRFVGDEADVEQMLTAVFVAARDQLTAGGSLVVETTHAGDLERGGDPIVAITAQGFGVLNMEPSDALRSAVERNGGVLETDHEPGRRSVLRVRFSA
jgi:hypothetical protein